MTDKKKAANKTRSGRPTIYSEKMLELAQEYMATWKEKGDAVPTVVGLALACEVATSTVYNWINQGLACDAFSVIFTRIEQEQHQALVNNGLFGLFNPAITKMMLTKHGYSDAQKVDHTTNGESINAISPAQAAIERFKKSNESEQ